MPGRSHAACCVARPRVPPVLSSSHRWPSPLPHASHQILDENSSPLLDANLAGRTAADLGVTEDGFAEANLKHAVNGFIYCNTPGLEMTQGER